MEFHERAEEILASADYPLSSAAGELNHLHLRFRRGPIHLHPVLNDLSPKLGLAGLHRSAGPATVPAMAIF
jgi:hypothetical protein